tara:strand:- start:10148 stop:11110 length:963 start_codon:yes stop_codon:yes gene_type:complete
MSTPFFSVVIPLYNKENYIEKCIRSVIDQTFADFEIIVIDDGSLDGSACLVEKVIDSRLRLLKQVNSGVAAARNAGILAAQGKYIAFLDADDWYEKNFLKEILDLTQDFNRCDAYATGYFRHKNGVKKDCMAYVSRQFERYVVKDFYKDWSKGAFFCASSCVVNVKYFWEKNKLFPVGESMGEDQELWFHIAENGAIAYSNKCLSNYNQGTENSLSFGSKITKELPFISRLKSRLNKGDVHKFADSARGFVERYELELSISNSVHGSKLKAIQLLWENRDAKGWGRLKLLALAMIVVPRWFVGFIRKLRFSIIEKKYNSQ